MCQVFVASGTIATRKDANMISPQKKSSPFKQIKIGPIFVDFETPSHQKKRV